MLHSTITFDQFATAMDVFMPFYGGPPSWPFQEQCCYFPDSPGSEFLPRYLERLAQQQAEHPVSFVQLEIPPAPTKPSSADYITRAFLEQLGETERLRSDNFVLRMRLQKYFQEHEVLLLIITGWQNLLTSHQHKIMFRELDNVRALLHSDLPHMYVLALADLNILERVLTSSFQLASMFYALLPLPALERGTDTTKRSNDMAKSKKNVPERHQELSPITVEYYWLAPDQPPQGTRDLYTDRPFTLREVFSIPQLEEFLTITLPFPEFHGLRTPSPVLAHGQVKAVTINRDQTHAKVVLERHGRVGLTWYELGACIGATMIAYDEPYGRIEGTLTSLYPSAELANLAVLGIQKLIDRYISLLELRGEDITDLLSEDEEDEDDEEGATNEEERDHIWVPWSALWPKSGVVAMQELVQNQPKKTRRPTNRR